jgi:hypothetical protein
MILSAVVKMAQETANTTVVRLPQGLGPVLAAEIIASDFFPMGSSSSV